MKFRWCFELALKYLFPSGKRFPFLSIISIIGVTLGVMILFVVGSVMDGFQSEICSKIVNTQGDIRVDSCGIITNSDQVLRLLESEDNVSAASGYIMGFLMMQFQDLQAYPLAKGVEMHDESKVMPIDKYIVEGDLEQFGDDMVIIGCDLARRLGIKIGDTVEVYSPLTLQDLQNDELILPRSFEVSAIYRSGWNQIDSNFLIFTKHAMEELYGMSDDECHGFSVKLQNIRRAGDTVLSLRHKLPGLRVSSWQEINEDFLFVLKLEKTMMMFVLFFILLIASFSIASSLMISVVKKRREIGLLCALGASLKEIASVFVFEGMIIGIFGCIFGLLFGTIALLFRNLVLAILTKIVGINDLMLRFYDFAKLPVKYSGDSILMIVIFTMLICCLAGLIPALAASKVKPANVLRNE
ncbi:MAG: ABC transporter permease [Opitutales bacterium]|nr:ABC transporter permease [Opitutales bacterium]